MKGEQFKPKKEDTTASISKKELDLKPKETVVDTAKKPKQKLKNNKNLDEKSVEDTSSQTSSFVETSPTLSKRQHKKLPKLRANAQKVEERYFKAEEKLPTRQKLKVTTEKQDEKPKVQLYF